MSIKTICDGCGDEICEWRPHPGATGPTGSTGITKSTGDGLKRELKISTGNNYQAWDLCDPCQGRVADALVELLPKTPREAWFDAIRPKRT